MSNFGCIILSLILGGLFGFLASIVALYFFRNSVRKNVSPCCAKCIHCSNKDNKFVCEKTGYNLVGILSPNNDCIFYKE